MTLDKAKKICRTLVDYYGNDAVDLQGGEPTLFKGIFDLVAFCRDIGLKPTLITNALLLDDIETCRRYKNAGIHDFLISVHGLRTVHNELVGRSDAHERQMKALRNLQETHIPFRFNCVLSKPVIPQLPDIADLAKTAGATVVNFITFNPFADQSVGGKRNTQNVPRYSDVRMTLTRALDKLDENEIEANVRYFPLCMLESRHRKSAYNFQQLSYDPHEWDFASWAWTGLQEQRTREGGLTSPFELADYHRLVRHKAIVKKLASIRFLKVIMQAGYGLYRHARRHEVDRQDLYRAVAVDHAEIHCPYAYDKKCSKCGVRSICDGFHRDYATFFGTDEADPVLTPEPVTDPLYYIREQMKVME